jgi:hypothetical protein
MDKGIRPECNRKFAELLPTRVNTREGNTAFRKAVIAHVMEQFGATLASAATHYNHAFIQAREAAKTNEELATLLVGLGRPEDKKGGRKKKEAPAQAAAETPAGGEEQVEPTPELFLVKKEKDGSVVGEPMTLEAAKGLVEAAKKAKKAKLFWIAV